MREKDERAGLGTFGGSGLRPVRDLGSTIPPNLQGRTPGDCLAARLNGDQVVHDLLAAFRGRHHQVPARCDLHLALALLAEIVLATTGPFTVDQGISTSVFGCNRVPSSGSCFHPVQSTRVVRRA